MTNESQEAADLHALQSLAELREQPFQSNVPVVGSLIAWFRSAWNSVSTKWYVRPMLAQQSEYNRRVIDLLSEMDSRAHQLQTVLDDLDQRLIVQDREKTHLLAQLGEASARLTQLSSALDALEAGAPADEERPD